MPAPDPGADPASAAVAEPELVPPQLLEFVEAELPPGTSVPHETVVAVSIEVLPNGAVGEVEVVESGGAVLDAAALQAARQMKFLGATYGGQPVPVKIKFNYKFVTVSEPAPPANLDAGPGTAATPEAPAEITLAGRSLQRGTRRPLLAVAVVVRQGEATVAQVETDRRGEFGVSLPPGAYTLHFRDPAHLPAELDATVVGGERTDLVVYLMPNSSDPYRTVVRTKRPRREVTRTTLQAREVTRVAGTFGEPFRVIEALPGLMRTPFTGGFLVVRGANPRDTGVYLDGHEIPLLYHFVVGSAVFNADLVRSIDFSPGNWSVRFGRRLGGLVEVRTQDDPPERLKASAELDLIDVGALGKLPVREDGAAEDSPPTGDVFAAVRRSHLDAVIAAVSDVGIAPRYWDYQVGAGTRLGDIWKGRLLMYGSDDRFEIVGDLGGQSGPSEGGEQTLGIAFHRLVGRAWRPLPGGRLDVSSSVGLDLVGFNFEPNTFETTGLNIEARADARFKPVQRLTVETGLDLISRRYSVHANTPDFPAPWWFPQVPGGGPGGGSGVRLQTDTDLVQFMPAAYLALDFEPTDGLHLIPGIRTDLFTGEGLNELTADPRFVARAQVSEELTFKGGVGRFHQPPEAFQVAQELGNTDLAVPQALHWSLGGEVKLGEALELDLTGFRIERSNLISISRQVEGDGATVQTERFDDTREERSVGMELLLRHKPVGSFFGWIAYTLSRTERRENKTLPWVRHTLDQPHVLTLVASYDLGGGWEVGSRVRLVSGNPVTPVEGCVDDLDTDQCEAVRGAEKSERLPPFFQIDARVDRRWTFDTWILSGYLDLMNVTNQANSEFLQWDHRFREQRFIPGVPILPSIGIKGEM